MEDNEHILIGRYLHRNMKKNQPGGDTLVHRHQWIWSDPSKSADAVEAESPTNSLGLKMANHLNDHFQLCAAALCLENFGAQHCLWGNFLPHQSAATKVTLHSNYVRQLNRRSQRHRAARFDASAHRASQVSGMQLTGNLPAV